LDGSLTGASGWLFDHYRFLESQIAETRDALPRRAYLRLPRPASSADAEPRVQALARCLVESFVSQNADDDNGQELPCLDADLIRAHFTDTGSDDALCLAELWAIKPLLKVSLLEALECSLHEEPLSSPVCERVVRATITGLYALDEVPWREVVESMSALDRVLRLDPADVYGRMDFETRDHYRKAAERISRRSAAAEDEVGRLAVELAGAGSPGTVDRDPTDHVGYYLLGGGVELLEQRAGYRPPAASLLCKWAARRVEPLYPFSIALTTIAILGVLTRMLRPEPWWAWLMLCIVPASQAAVAIVNRIVHAWVPPRRLPRLDFSEGVPGDCRTFVVVPALLLSRASVDALVERLEIHHLANRDPNIRLALLTDGPDADSRTTDADDLADRCREAIDELNRRYAADGGGPFYHFHRGRRWNDTESVWMAHERKRGKLVDFDRFLLGESDVFASKAGDLGAIGAIRYVITLDADTQLPLDVARQLIGTAAHPLNRPVIDARTGMVTAGYSVLQPRIGISMMSAEHSRLTALHNSTVGIDLYTTAVSDVYQDLYGRGSFTGKGLYDLTAFHHSVGDRFPENALLSHDLIEGEHARVGLVTEVELIDDYPGSYDAYSKRKHRWMRGDWQLLPWLSSRVPDAAGSTVPNPLSLISRWKIADNLRRSAIELSAVGMLVYGWSQHHALAYLIAVMALLNAGAYLDLLISIHRLPPRRLLRSFARSKLAQIGQSHLETFAWLVLLPHQALVAADAMIRTLVRLFVTRRHLLEWESMAQAQADTSPHRSRSLVRKYLLLTPAVSCAVFLMLRATGRAPGAIPILVTAVWMASPWFANWMDRRTGATGVWTPEDLEFLRGTALRTWRYFAEWSRPETHWLAPDNVDAASGYFACRTSPTNIGLQLGATLAAFDFGYLTHQELARDVGHVLETLESLERHRGHFYNWIDIGTLQPLEPRYVSSVDSGNLCAALLTVSQGCTDILTRPIVNPSIWGGLRDHFARLREALPATVRSQLSCRRLGAMLARESPSDDLRAWTRVIDATRPLAASLSDHVHRSAAGFGTRPHDPEDARYWAYALMRRIDAVREALQRFTPLVQGSLPEAGEDAGSAELLCELGEAAARAVPLSEMDDHYDRLERRLMKHVGSSATLPPAVLDYLWTLHQRITAARSAAHHLVLSFRALAFRASETARETDFTFLFDSRRKLLRVGYTVATRDLDPYCYGHLASEARTAVFLAIAKHDIPREAWFHLSRKLVTYGKYRTLLSWSGSMFEYAMPTIFMKTYENTLLWSSVRRAVVIQQLYARERHVPWGISEAAYHATDGGQERRYQAFGVPGLAMKRLRPSDLIVAPYATVLALTIDGPAAIANLRKMTLNGWTGRYGFFESIDYRGHGAAGSPAPHVVPLFMAHHQAMSLMALDNAVFDGVLQKRFHAEPLVLAAELLLQERLPRLIPESEPEPSAESLATHLQAASPSVREIAGAPERVVLSAS
jgi:hypothetical protein